MGGLIRLKFKLQIRLGTDLDYDLMSERLREALRVLFFTYIVTISCENKVTG